MVFSIVSCWYMCWWSFRVSQFISGVFVHISWFLNVFVVALWIFVARLFDHLQQQCEKLLLVWSSSADVLTFAATCVGIFFFFLLNCSWLMLIGCEEYQLDYDRLCGYVDQRQLLVISSCFLSMQMLIFAKACTTSARWMVGWVDFGADLLTYWQSGKSLQNTLPVRILDFGATRS